MILWTGDPLVLWGQTCPWVCPWGDGVRLSARSGCSLALCHVLTRTIGSGGAGTLAQLAVRPRTPSPARDTKHLCRSVLLLAVAGSCLDRKIPFPRWDLLLPPQGGGCPGAGGLSAPQRHRWCEAIPLTSRIPVRDRWQSRAKQGGGPHPGGLHVGQTSSTGPGPAPGGCECSRDVSDPLSTSGMLLGVLDLAGAGGLRAGGLLGTRPPVLRACEGKSSVKQSWAPSSRSSSGGEGSLFI